MKTARPGSLELRGQLGYKPKSAAYGFFPKTVRQSGPGLRCPAAGYMMIYQIPFGFF
jgi:hypothetical protein